MKRWFAIIFLSFFALNFAGQYIYFAFRLIDIKNEMRAALRLMPEEQLTRLVVTEAEFKKSRVEEHEIKINGRMYDIARIDIKNGNIIVWCLHDEAEDNLLSFLNAVTSRAHHDNHPVPAAIVKFLTLNYLISDFTFSPCQPAGTKPFVACCRAASPPFCRISSPPPEA